MNTVLIFIFEIVQCMYYLSGIFVQNTFAEYLYGIFFAKYFYGLFMTTIFYRHPIINGLIACNICGEYLFRIFMPNISM